eukprot:gene1330-2571_t
MMLLLLIIVFDAIYQNEGFSNRQYGHRSTFLVIDTSACHKKNHESLETQIINLSAFQPSPDEVYHYKWLQTIVKADTSSHDTVAIEWQFSRSSTIADRLQFLDKRTSAIQWTLIINETPVGSAFGTWIPSDTFGSMYNDVLGKFGVTSQSYGKLRGDSYQQQQQQQYHTPSESIKSLFHMNIDQLSCSCNFIFNFTTYSCEDSVITFETVSDDSLQPTTSSSYTYLTNYHYLDLDRSLNENDNKKQEEVRDFQRSRETRVYAADGSANDNFGNSVDICGNLSVIGAYAANINGVPSGAAFIYRINDTGWHLEARVTAETSNAHDFFGWSVAAHHNVVIVGAYMAQGNNGPIGAAYIFTPRSSSTSTSTSTWTRQATLRASNTNGNSNSGGTSSDYVYFGWSVDVYESLAFVGAYGDNELGSFAGSVYIFQRTVSGGKNSYMYWSQTSKLIASDGAAFDSFGWCVSLHGNYAIIGAYGDTNAEDTYAGSAYIFSNVNSLSGTSTGTWSEQAKLLPPDGARHDFFGWTVALWEQTAVVGAHWSSVDNHATGAAYVFVRYEQQGWSLQAKLTPKDADRSLYFGYSVSMYSAIIAVSAFGDSYNTANSGVAYVFSGRGTGSNELESRVWQPEARLAPNRTGTHDDFGVCIAIWGDIVLVGAKHADGIASESGAVFSYNKADLSYRRTYFPVDSNTFVLLIALVPVAFIVLFGIAFFVMVRFFPSKNQLQQSAQMIVCSSDDSMASTNHSVNSILLVPSTPSS